MKEQLFEILCPDGYVKNGFDKTKLKNIFANSMIVNYDKNTFTLDHIDTSDGKKTTIRDFSKHQNESIFKIVIDNDCKLSNLADSTINLIRDSIENGNVEFILENPNNLKLTSEEYEILKQFKYEI